MIQKMGLNIINAIFPVQVLKQNYREVLRK